MSPLVEYMKCADEATSDIILSNWVHRIKYSQDGADALAESGIPDFNALGEKEKIRCAVAATVIEGACANYGRKMPGWVRDENLCLKKPYLGLGYSIDWLFTAPQACLNHNVFIDPATFGAV